MDYAKREKKKKNMNVEELRNYCLSLGADVEEKMPFQAFKAARGVLAFYVCGHMFCYFDVDRFSTVSLKCRSEDIDDLKERHPEVGSPYNLSAKHWIGVDATAAAGDLLRGLTRRSYLLVKQQYTPHKRKTK